ncbi:hypothetical protein EON63_09140 [archaeon]|nr:MAG: hypothetical protein EON63_09140 [archaeon]
MHHTPYAIYHTPNTILDVRFNIKEHAIKISTDYSGVISLKFSLSGTQFLPAAEPVVNPTSYVDGVCVCVWCVEYGVWHSAGIRCLGYATLL